jgi:hypothetical protein
MAAYGMGQGNFKKLIAEQGDDWYDWLMKDQTGKYHSKDAQGKFGRIEEAFPRLLDTAKIVQQGTPSDQEQPSPSNSQPVTLSELGRVHDEGANAKLDAINTTLRMMANNGIPLTGVSPMLNLPQEPTYGKFWEAENNQMLSVLGGHNTPAMTIGAQ